MNGKKYTYYQATQKQRQMERSIRATKREIEAQKAIGGNTDDLRASLRRQRGEYYKFSADVNIRPKDNRLRVIGGAYDLKKTKSMKYYDSFVKSGSDDIIKAKEKERIIGNDSFRITKSKFLKSDYEEIKELRHSLSDRDVRLWYKAKDADIVNMIDKKLPLREQAMMAFEMRNTYRTQARELMKD